MENTMATITIITGGELEDFSMTCFTSIEYADLNYVLELWGDEDVICLFKAIMIVYCIFLYSCFMNLSNWFKVAGSLSELMTYNAE